MKNLKAECVRCGAAIKASTTYCSKCRHEIGRNTLTPKVRKIVNQLSFLLLFSMAIYLIVYFLL